MFVHLVEIPPRRKKGRLWWRVGFGSLLTKSSWVWAFTFRKEVGFRSFPTKEVEFGSLVTKTGWFWVVSCEMRLRLGRLLRKRLGLGRASRKQVGFGPLFTKRGWIWVICCKKRSLLGRPLRKWVAFRSPVAKRGWVWVVHLHLGHSWRKKLLLVPLFCLAPLSVSIERVRRHRLPPGMLVKLAAHHTNRTA